jgi:hypothetical protein
VSFPVSLADGQAVVHNRPSSVLKSFSQGASYAPIDDRERRAVPALHVYLTFQALRASRRALHD